MRGLDFGSGLRGVLGRRVATAALLILIGVAFPAHDALSGTPHSTPKSCGYGGGPNCPSSAVDVTQWRYVGQYGTSPWYGSASEVMSYIVNTYTTPPGTWCTGSFTTPTVSSSSAEYGITIYEQLNSTLTVVGFTNLNPPCQSTPTSNLPKVVLGNRTASCPGGYSLVYVASPLTGPDCTTSATPIPIKQTGCPWCSQDPANSGGANAGSGGLPKANAVDISNANKYQTEADYTGVGTDPLKFVRNYNSLNAQCLPAVGAGGPYLGGGWSATYFQTLVPVTVTDSTRTYNTVYAYRPDGRVLAFNQYNGVYSPDGDVAESLIQTANGWQYQSADDTIETYNSFGQLISIAARGQAAVTINYSAGSGPSDPPVSASDAFGRSLQFTYSVNSSNTLQLASITDPAGRTIAYSHDVNGRLVTVTQSDSTTRTYGYSSTSSCRLTGITDEASVLYASWTYNGSNQPATSQNAGGVNSYSFTYSESGTGGHVQVTDPLGTARTYNQSLIWGAYRTTSSSAVCPGCGEDASRVFDANGNISSRTDFNGNQTHYVYDVTTNLESSRTEAYGTAQARTVTTTWDPNWRQPDLITEPNRTTAFTYDSMGNVLTKTVTDTTVTPSVARTWTYTYDSYGRMLTAKGPRTDVNSTTTYTYYTCTTGAQCGQLNTVTDPVGNVTTYNTYNSHGQPLRITDPNGTVTTLTYDNRERLTSRQVGTETTSFTYWPTGLLKQVTLPDSSYILYTYDTAHRLTKISDAAGNSIQYTLDNMGNRTAEKSYDPSSVLHRTHTRVFNTLNQLYQDVNAANTAAVTTTYGYDSNGNQNSIAAPLTRNTANTFDPLNRLSQITDPASGVTKFGYDANDNLTSVKDPRLLTTSYGYNGFGDILQQISPDTGTSSSTYDSGGNLSVSTDARGATANHSYDAANRVTQIVYKNSGGVSDQTITFGYDAGTNGKGRLTSASDASHSLSWSYDSLGRVTGKGLTIGTVNKSVGYGYTNADLTAIVTPSGQSVTYGYNSNHQVTSVAVNGTTVLSSATYEPFGGVNGWSWGNGTTVSRSFNGDGLVSQIVTAGTTLGYGFDNANRITGISDSSNSALSWAYGYDALDRLTSAMTSAITDGWTYDANGNRLTQTGTTPITFSVSSTNNQLTATSGGLVRSYGYDAAGNVQGNGTYTFGYNDRGRMAGTTASSTNYLYNALGQMIEKSGTLGTTILMQDEAGHLIGEYDGTGALMEETVWLGDIPVATLQPNGSGGVNIFYVHTDHLNTPRKVSRPSDNQLEWRWDTDPFGTTAANQNPAGLGTFVYNLRFPGQTYQAETGLSQNMARDYDPAVGRYVESDPIGLKGGINTYTYVKNYPTMHTDRFGLDIDFSTAVEKAIEYYKKVCKKDDETCQQYQARLYRECVTGPLPMQGPGCKIVSEQVAQPCIEGDVQRVACKKAFACTGTTNQAPSS
jgi:RHS repeat-associated protein